MKESPRWLVQKRKSKEALISLKFVTSLNRQTFNDNFDVFETESISETKTKKYTFINLFSTRRMALITVVLCICM